MANGSSLALPTDSAIGSIQAIWYPSFWCSYVFMRKTKDEIEEFDCLDIFGGVDGIVDEDLFDDEVVDEGNMFD